MLDKQRFRENLERKAVKSRKQFPFVLALAIGSLLLAIRMLVVNEQSSIPLGAKILALPTVCFGSWAISLWFSRTVNYAEADEFIDRINARGARHNSKR